MPNILIAEHLFVSLNYSEQSWEIFTLFRGARVFNEQLKMKQTIQKV